MPKIIIFSALILKSKVKSGERAFKGRGYTPRLKSWLLIQIYKKNNSKFPFFLNKDITI